MHCSGKNCGEDLEFIAIDIARMPVKLFPSETTANLYVCISSDCENCGIVMCIPNELKSGPEE